MKNLYFLQNDEKFFELLKSKEENLPEDSVLPLLDKILKENKIYLKNNFFLESYLLSNNDCEFLNIHFVQLFNKTVYLNEKEAMLKYLLINNYDKKFLCNMIFKEIKNEYPNHSSTEVENYKWFLCDTLHTIGLKEFENQYIELLLDKSLGESREMLIPLLKKIKCKQRNEVFNKLKETDTYFNDYKFF